MARDYATKPRKTGSRPPAQRRPQRKKKPPAPRVAGWSWALAGLALGLFIAFLVYLKEHRADPPPAAKAPAGADEGRTRFDFYTILPEQEVVVPDEPTTPGRAEGEPAAERASYILQAGSFRTPEQADSLRARLALLGVEANVQRVTVAGGEVWHRVRIGPMENVRDIARIQERLRRSEIQSLRLKIRD